MITPSDQMMSNKPMSVVRRHWKLVAVCILVVIIGIITLSIHGAISTTYDSDDYSDWSKCEKMDNKLFKSSDMEGTMYGTVYKCGHIRPKYCVSGGSRLSASDASQYDSGKTSEFVSKTPQQCFDNLDAAEQWQYDDVLESERA